MKTLKSLIIEDSDDDFALLLLHLSRAGYDVEYERVQTADEMKRALIEKQWDIVISDYQMPNFTGLEAHTLLKETGLDIPFILISGVSGEETAVEAMLSGVSDYLMKDKMARLAPAIERELKEAVQRHSRRKAETNLRASEKHLKMVLTAARMSVWEWDLQTDEVYWSPECAELLKTFNFGENIDDFQKLLHPEDVATVFNEAKKAVDNHTIFSAEFRIVNSQGNVLWLANRAIAEYDETGKPLQLVGTISDITERVKLQQKLTASEAHFRVLAENNVAGVTLCEADGTLIYANDAYLKIIGYTREDFENGQLNWRQITAVEYFEIDEKAIAETRANGKSEPYEKEYVCKDGNRVVVLLALASSKLDGSEYFISAILDITKRREAEKEWRKSEENFRALVQATSQKVWTISNDNSISDFHYWWMELTGQNLEESLGSGWLDAVHPEDRETARITWQHSLETFSLFDIVYRVWTHKNEYCYYAVRGVPVFEQNGKFRQWIGTFTDINERKKIEEKLRESERRLQLSQQAARVSTWEWDLLTSKAIWSNGMWELVGRMPGETPQDYQSWKYFTHPEDRILLSNALKSAIQGKDILDLEYRLIGKDGQIVWAAAKGRVTRDKNGKAERILGVNIDITERKKAEEDLHKSEEKLQQAHKIESIGRLAGGIAHDFNNMLTAINGYSDLTLRRMREDDPLRNNILEIREAGERSATLTRQLLAFSRRQILQLKIVNINQIVTENTGLLRRLIGEDVQIVTVLNSDTSQIKADAGQMSQVVMNLAVNSRDSMPKGGTIRIETGNVSFSQEDVRQNIGVEVGDYVHLSVSDNGSGIDKETLEHIFEPFYTTKEIGKGTGLGLATVHGIITQLGGYIIVDSVVGTGTTFKIYLPRVEESVEAKISSGIVEDSAQGTGTILLVEDEIMVRTLTKKILETKGYKILEANNGEEALKIFRATESRIDLLLTDVVMPKMGGYELAENLLKMNPALKILFTSGYTEDSRIKHEIVGAKTDFIHKPFTPDALAIKVREVCAMS